MARPRTPINAHGKIATRKLEQGYEASARYRAESGRLVRVRRYAHTSAAAKVAVQRAIAEAVAAGEQGGKLTARSTVATLATHWLEFQEAAGAAPGSLRQYGSVVRTHIVPLIGDLTVGELTTSRAQAFLAGIATAGSAQNARRALSGMFTLAVRDGALRSNPVRDTAGRRSVKKAGQRSIPTEDRAAFEVLLQADASLAAYDVADLLVLQLRTGLRVGEACALRWSDVASHTLRVAGTTVRIKGRGIVRQEFPKTERSNRVIAIAEEVSELLERRGRGSADDPVFPALRGGWREGSEVQKRLRDQGASLGYPQITTHWFRRTVATVLDDAGLSARQIADYLGHANPSTTQDIYMQRAADTTAAANALAHSGQ